MFSRSPDISRSCGFNLVVLILSILIRPFLSFFFEFGLCRSLCLSFSRSLSFSSFGPFCFCLSFCLLFLSLFCMCLLLSLILICPFLHFARLNVFLNLALALCCLALSFLQSLVLVCVVSFCVISFLCYLILCIVVLLSCLVLHYLSGAPSSTLSILHSLSLLHPQHATLSLNLSLPLRSLIASPSVFCTLSCLFCLGSYSYVSVFCLYLCLFCCLLSLESLLSLSCVLVFCFSPNFLLSLLPLPYLPKPKIGKRQGTTCPILTHPPLIQASLKNHRASAQHYKALLPRLPVRLFRCLVVALCCTLSGDVRCTCFLTLPLPLSLPVAWSCLICSLSFVIVVSSCLLL